MTDSVKDLEIKIKKYATSYYEGNPEISDEEFDKLVDELKEKDPNNKLLSTVGWGYELSDPLTNQEEHLFEIGKFEDKIKKVSELGLNRDEGVISVKIDGGSILCYYEKGILIKALTRGNGIVGYSVTKKMKKIAPSSLEDKTFSGLVRGEIAMKNSVFNSKYSSNYSSARNLAVGMIKRDKLNMEELRDLSFVAYTVRGTTSQKLDSKTKVFEWLKKNRFEVVDTFNSNDWTDESFRELIKSYEKYPIDGLVITSHKYKELDDGTFIPEREVAYKTNADSVEVEVTDITWNLTRTGKLFPTVWFTPVKLSGATVQKATAFNAKFIEEEGLGIGSKILIQRSGEIIPDVMEVLTRKEYKFPDICPKCGNPLTKKGVHLVCESPDCKGYAYNSLEHWIQTITELKGLGSSTIEDFTNSLGIDSIDTFYKKIDLIPNLFSKTSATRNLMNKMIKLLRTPISFSKFLNACNISMIGRVASDELSGYKDLILFDKIDDNWIEKINSIKGCNITAKKNLIDKIEIIRRYSNYVTFEENSIQNNNNIEKGVVAITGALSVPRDEFVKEITQAGWKFATSVSSRVNYLVTDNPNSGSSKNKKAQTLGVKVVSEKEFRKIMNK